MAKIPLQKINPNRKIRYARDEIHRTKILNRKRRRKLRLMTLLVVFLILFILGLLSLRHQAIRIEDIEISGNKVIAKDSILKESKKLLEGNSLLIIPRSSVFFYPKDEIKNTLLAKFGYLETVDINSSLLGTLKIKVTERQGKYTWCADGADSRCFLATSEGFVFAPVATNSNALFKIVGLGDGEIIKPFVYPIGKNKFNNLVSRIETLPQTVNKLSGGKLSVGAVTLSPADDYVFKVRDRSQGNVYEWNLLVSGRTDLQNLGKHLEAVFLSTEFRNQMASGASLEYVDFRFGKKVFYKYLDYNIESVETAEETDSDNDEVVVEGEE